MSDYYVRNRYRRCQRCMSHWLMGPAVLITLGVLFLLEQLHVARFGKMFPILLIVIGAVQIARRTASEEGHIQPPVYMPPVPPVPPAGAGFSSSSGSEVNRG
jgi:uncharacterized membrane protein YfcA